MKLWTGCAVVAAVVASILHAAVRQDWKYPHQVLREHAPDSLSDTVAVVTGANSGVGLETARALVHGGATVVLACRAVDRCQAAALDVTRSAANAAQTSFMNVQKRVLTATCDLEESDSISAFASWLQEQFERIDVLILNAGVTGIGWFEVRRSQSNVEKRLMTNHIGHHYLTKLLRPVLWDHPEKGKSRIVVVSSRSHKFR